MRCFEAALAREEHGFLLRAGDERVDIPLSVLYEAPLSWSIWRAAAGEAPNPPSQICGVGLGRLLEMQSLAPGLLVRYLLGIRFSGRLGYNPFPPSLILSFNSRGAGAKFGEKAEAKWTLPLSRLKKPGAPAGLDSSQELLFVGPSAPFGFLRVGCTHKVKNFVISYGVGVVVVVVASRGNFLAPEFVSRLVNLGAGKRGEKRQQDSAAVKEEGVTRKICASRESHEPQDHRAIASATRCLNSPK